MKKVILTTFGLILTTVTLVIGTVYCFQQAYDIYTGKFTREKVAILNEINEKIVIGENLVKEITEENIKISFSKDELNDRYIVRLNLDGGISENIYTDESGEIISIEKNDHSLGQAVGLTVFGGCLVLSVLISLFVIVGTILVYIQSKKERKCPNLEE